MKIVASYIDLDECQRLANCDGNQLCQNTPTYYYCICRPGFTFINGTCQVGKYTIYK